MLFFRGFGFATKVGFVGVGQMGRGMIQNLAKHYEVLAYDTNPNFMDTIENKTNIKPEKRLQKLAEKTDVFVLMLPNDKACSKVVKTLSEGAKKNSLILDCSTISPYSVVEINNEASQKGHRYIDTPVSGGIGGAAAGTLSFMVGTDDQTVFDEAEQYLNKMGKNIFKCGKLGGGQGAKICNNMALAIEMIAVSEALALGNSIGLDPHLLSKIMSVSSSRCWSLDTYNPAPGVMPNVPSSKDYEGGFACELMLKDLGIAKEIILKQNQSSPLGIHSQEIYSKLCERGLNKKDFSIIYELLVKKNI